MMHDAITSFAEQFHYTPSIENLSALKTKKRFVVLGMGGSHLGADLIAAANPLLPITIHSDYGLPSLPAAELKDSLIIASSYSGNTEEVIDGLTHALKQKQAVAVISVGGKLIDIARKKGLPYIELPNTGIQPRSALGFSVLALLAIMKQKSMLREVQRISATLKPLAQKAAGKSLAAKMYQHVPVIYSSQKNRAVAYNWKIKLNETGKIPAFYNVFPEMNHNEMTGFDAQGATQSLSMPFYFLFLTDSTDHLGIQKRMKVMKRLYQKRGLAVHELPLKGDTAWERIFRSLLLADWTAVHTAEQYGVESEQVPMVEEFKKLIA